MREYSKKQAAIREVLLPCGAIRTRVGLKTADPLLTKSRNSNFARIWPNAKLIQGLPEPIPEFSISGRRKVGRTSSRKVYTADYQVQVRNLSEVCGQSRLFNLGIFHGDLGLGIASIYRDRLRICVSSTNGVLAAALNPGCKTNSHESYTTRAGSCGAN